MTPQEWFRKQPRDRHCAKHGWVTRWHGCSFQDALKSGKPEKIARTVAGMKYNHAKGDWE